MTTYHARADGCWLRLEPHAPTVPATTRAIRRLLPFGVVMSALVLAAAAAGFGIRELAADGSRTPVGVDSSATTAPAGVAEAAVQTPSPGADLAASFVRWSREYGVPIALLQALTWHESRWQPHAVSEAGAVGLAQMMPSTAAAVESSLGLDLDPTVPDDAVRMAAHLVATLLTSADGDVRIALAGYTQGAWSVKAHGMTPTTRRYVDDVTARYEQFRASSSHRR